MCRVPSPWLSPFGVALGIFKSLKSFIAVGILLRVLCAGAAFGLRCIGCLQVRLLNCDNCTSLERVLHETDDVVPYTNLAACF